MFETNPKQGYFIVLAQDFVQKTHQWKHVFCGEHDIPGAICSNCKKPLLRFLSLDTKDSRLNLTEVLSETLSLFYCWTCQLAQDHFYYAQLPNDSVNILYYRKGECYSDFPYENYPIYFPKVNIHLQAISIEEQEIIKGMNRQLVSPITIEETRPEISIPRHQIGGEPFRVQPDIDEKVQCLKCASSMPFLAAISDQGPHESQFTMNDFVQVIFHLCRKCSVIAAYHKIE